jgi:hypothetical protein
MKKIIIVSILFLMTSCANKTLIKGSYFNKCYLYHLPMLVINIEDSTYVSYSPAVKGQKGTGFWLLENGQLTLIEKKTLTNNFKDTLLVSDTTRYKIRNKRLIPSNYEDCYFIKTNDKSKLIQID